MGRGEFEEILEECLSALLEGRRSVDESLSLYPAWKDRLEPLLRAAEEIAASLNEGPPPYARERGLERFLEAAHTRRRLRAILPRQVAGTPWWRWASAGVAAVVAVGVLAFMSATLMAEDGRRLSSGVRVSLYSPPAERPAPQASVQTPLEQVQERVAVLENFVRHGEPVEVGLLAALEEASNELAADLDGPEEMGLVDRAAVVSITTREYELLQTLQGQAPGVQAEAVEESLAAAADVLEKLGATPEPEPGASPSSEPTSSPAAAPSAEPSSTPDGGETPAPSATHPPAP